MGKGNVCPCCKQTIRKVRDKKLNDIAKAKLAVNVLSRFLNSGRTWGSTESEDALLKEAAMDELLRLESALPHAEKLKRIFRRKET